MRGPSPWTEQQTKTHGSDSPEPRATQQGKAETWPRTQSPALWLRLVVSQLDLAECLHPAVHICQPLSDETMARSRATDLKHPGRTVQDPPRGGAGSHMLGLSRGQPGPAGLPLCWL